MFLFIILAECEMLKCYLGTRTHCISLLIWLVTASYELREGNLPSLSLYA